MYTCFCFISEKGKWVSEGSFTYWWQDTGFIAIPTSLLFQQPKGEMVLEAVAIPASESGCHLLFLCCQSDGGGGGAMVRGREPKDSCLKARAVLERGG